MNLKLQTDKILPFVRESDLALLQKDMHYHHQVLLGRTGPGSDFLGWMYLPSDTEESLVQRIEEEAARLRGLAEVLVVVGIGGSYLGARAVVEALGNPFGSLSVTRGRPVMVYAGQNISEDYMSALARVVDQRDCALIVISKSGTTTEPALAFRILKQQMERKYGVPGARKRIVAITDQTRGALKSLSDREGYSSFVIPDDVGGRYSVLTPVGLLPIAAAGFDIRAMLSGAKAMQEAATASALFEENPAAHYAAARNALYRVGKPLEVLVNYEPALSLFGEWWKQLYGESEGKQQRGIFPASMSFTTDLHSLGQYVQDGLRVLFETVISVERPEQQMPVPYDESDADGMNFLAGKALHHINHMAELGTTIAHYDGGVPVMRISIPRINEHILGELIYFFEFACALSGYIMEVNPFDQPGVEAYKRNMFALLGKAGFEKEGQELRNRLGL